MTRPPLAKPDLKRARAAHRTPKAAAAGVLASVRGGPCGLRRESGPQPLDRNQSYCERLAEPESQQQTARLFFLGKKVVDDRVEEDTTNTDAAAEELKQFAGAGDEKRRVKCVLSERAGAVGLDNMSYRLRGCRQGTHLERVKGLAHHDSHADDDDDALGGVGDGLGHGAGLLEGHRGELVVAVEPEAGHDHVELDGRVGLPRGAELSPTRALAPDGERNRE